MITIAQLLELLYGAHTRFDSVSANIRVEIDHGLLERSNWPEDAVNPPPPRVEPQTCVARLWADAAGRLRVERDVDGQLEVEVTGVGAEEADVDESESLAEGFADLFDPAPLLGTATFEILGESTQAGRAAVTVLARPRGRSIEMFDMWGCDVHELAVDLERGLLLRIVGRIGGETAAAITVEEIAFDEPLAPDLFEREPQDEHVLRREESEPWRSETVSLRAAAEQTLFTLWVVRELLDEWRMYVLLVEDAPPASEPAWVEILYRGRDGANRVELNEQRASDATASGWTSYSSRPPRLIEHRGERILVLAQEPYETQLALTRGETQISISAIDGLEETLKIVDALAPVRLGDASSTGSDLTTPR